MAYWVSVLLRLCRSVISDAEPPAPTTSSAEGRVRTRHAVAQPDEAMVINGAELFKRQDQARKGQHSVIATLESLARACHLRTDDVQLVLEELEFLRCRRKLPLLAEPVDETEDNSAPVDAEELGEWHGVEVVISRDMVDSMWRKWRVREEAVLDERYCLL